MIQKGAHQKRVVQVINQNHQSKVVQSQVPYKIAKNEQKGLNQTLLGKHLKTIKFQTSSFNLKNQKLTQLKNKDFFEQNA